MDYRIDFSLGRSFSTVDRIVFHLVLNGYSYVVHLRYILSLFSERVLAASIRDLVNLQLIVADVETFNVQLSAPVKALISACGEKRIKLALPEPFASQMADGKLQVSDLKLKEAILHDLLPGLRMDFIAKAVDFYVIEEGGDLDE